MPNELAKTIINRDVIYVYKQPEISQRRREESGIDALFREYVKKTTDYSESEDREFTRKKDEAFHDFSNLVNLLNSYDGNIFAYDKIIFSGISKTRMTFIDMLEKLETEQKNWYPTKYLSELKKQRSIIFDGIKDKEQAFEDFFVNFSSTASAEIEKMKEEMPAVCLLSILEMESLQETEKVHFLNTKKFSSGQVFIKHPFMPNTYMNIETSEAELFHIKMQCLSRIMQCLGATRVSGHAYVSESKRREMDANGKVSYKVVDGEISVHSDKNERYKSDYVLEDSFAGEFSESSYAEAISEAKRVGLYDDFDIKNLLEQRNPQKQNTMTGRKVKIEMTRELNESLDVAFSLQAAGFGMNGNYKEILENQKKVMFELDIQF